MTKKTYNIISSVLVGVSVGVGMYFDLTLLERILAVIIMPGSFLLLYRKKLKKWIYSVLGKKDVSLGFIFRKCHQLPDKLLF